MLNRCAVGRLDPAIEGAQGVAPSERASLGEVLHWLGRAVAMLLLAGVAATGIFGDVSPDDNATAVTVSGLALVSWAIGWAGRYVLDARSRSDLKPSIRRVDCSEATITPAGMNHGACRCG